jgi:putative hemolysin
MAEIRQPQTLDIEAVIKAKAGAKADRIPRFLIKWFKKFIHIDFINEYLEQGYVGVDFCEHTIEYLGVNLEISGLENLPKDGRRFTFASNHPLGAIDGVTLGAIVGREYDKKVKYLMNDLLMNLNGLAPLGIPINKLGGQARNLSQLVDEVFQSENQIVIFPAGLCSRKIDGKIQDLPWSKAFVKKSRESGRDIIPVHFDGQNSKRFYRIATWCKKLGIKFNLAMMMLPDEMYKSRGKTYKVTFGKPISIDSLDKSKSDKEWAQEIRSIVYTL